jgi:hypothetical protein
MKQCGNTPPLQIKSESIEVPPNSIKFSGVYNGFQCPLARVTKLS